MIKITEQNYLDTIKEGKSVIFATTKFCGHCMALKPVFNLVTDHLTDHKCGMVDLQDEEGLIDVLGVTNIPVVIVYKDGKELGRTLSVDSEVSLEKWIKDLTNK